MEVNQTEMEGRKPQRGPAPQEKLPAGAHLLCGWPLVMVAIGGAIGGGLGGLAYGLNITLYKSRMPLWAKVLLNLAAGFSAFGLWLWIAIMISGKAGHE
jgi:hypothetical protein